MEKSTDNFQIHVNLIKLKFFRLFEFYTPPPFDVMNYKTADICYLPLPATWKFISVISIQIFSPRNILHFNIIIISYSLIK